jgi:DNA-binding transcriptional MocR family regulator
MHPVRRFGPTAWAVLAELRNRSVDVDDELVAQVSIRALAAELGLAKNTVHRAICRLYRDGLIEARQARTSAGTFTSGHYVLLPNPLDACQPPTTDDREPLPPHRVSVGDQLTLGI